jgi:membrane associated rhomboid family serine protease
MGEVQLYPMTHVVTATTIALLLSTCGTYFKLSARSSLHTSLPDVAFLAGACWCVTGTALLLHPPVNDRSLVMRGSPHPALIIALASVVFSLVIGIPYKYMIKISWRELLYMCLLIGFSNIAAINVPVLII